jgi:cytochrome P450
MTDSSGEDVLMSRTTREKPMNYYEELESTGSDHLKNELLFALLCDDEQRPKAYADLRQRAPVYKFGSRARRGPEDRSEQAFVQAAYLLTRREDIERALKELSNTPYKGLGSGTFVLALDNDEGHEDKRAFLQDALLPGASVEKITRQSELNYVAALAAHHAMAGVRKSTQFDLVTDVAEQAALRFVAAFFGLPDLLHLSLQDSMRKTYVGMIYQMFSRHFVTDPQLLSDGNQAMTTLARTVGGLIKQIDIVPLAAKLTPIVAHHGAAASKVFGSVAQNCEHIAALQDLVQKYCKSLEEPKLAMRTAQLFDRILDFAAVRNAISGWIEDVRVDSTLKTTLQAILAGSIALKASRDEQLVPRTFELTAEKRLKFVTKDSDEQHLHSRETVLEHMVRSQGARSTTELAIATVGAIAGLVGNVIAGTCIAIDRFFRLSDEARVALVKIAAEPKRFDDAGIEAASRGASRLQPFVREALRLQPPAAFVPRMTATEPFRTHALTIPPNTEVIIPLGAATRDLPPTEQPDEYDAERAGTAWINMFGQASADPLSHRCLGEHISMHLISHIVRGVLALPGLSQQVRNGEPVALKKKWGYICESYPLTYSRATVLEQQPLNVVMKIRTPTEVHAPALKALISATLPQIERVLATSEIVHFARFVFLRDDTELGLFTVYDGPFDDYIEHFAKVAGALFDKIFEHIDPTPPLPVHNYPTQFVELIGKFNIESAGGYFFSAYPTRSVKEINATREKT